MMLPAASRRTIAESSSIQSSTFMTELRLVSCLSSTCGRLVHTSELRQARIQYFFLGKEKSGKCRGYWPSWPPARLLNSLRSLITSDFLTSQSRSLTCFPASRSDRSRRQMYSREQPASFVASETVIMPSIIGATATVRNSPQRGNELFARPPNEAKPVRPETQRD